MNFREFGKIMVKIFSILNLIRKTTNQLGVSSDWVFDRLDSETGKEALKTATEVFIKEVERLAEGPEYEVWESPNLMTWGEAMAWASTIGEEWRLPSGYDAHWRFKEDLIGKTYWVKEEGTDHGHGKHGRIFWKESSGSGSQEKSTKNNACVIRELPKKTWRLV